jgi:SEL1 protein
VKRPERYRVTVLISRQDCMTALDYYESAAERCKCISREAPLTISAYATYLSGPPGGLTLPLTPTRLTDRLGGLYGPHASWASTGVNSLRSSIKSSFASSRGETESEILEYYQYHSDRDSYLYTVRLGRLFYLGSVYPIPGGVAMGGEGCGEIGRDWKKAWGYFMKVARVVWPVDIVPGGGGGNTGGVQWGAMRKVGLEEVGESGRVAAGFLGRMLIRGDGVQQNFAKGRMWFERAAELVSFQLWLACGGVEQC